MSSRKNDVLKNHCRTLQIVYWNQFPFLDYYGEFSDRDENSPLNVDTTSFISEQV